MTNNKATYMACAAQFAELAAGTNFRAAGDGAPVLQVLRNALDNCEKVRIPQDIAMYLASALTYACDCCGHEVRHTPKVYIKKLREDASKINKVDTVQLLDELANCWGQIKDSTYTYRFLSVLAQYLV